MSESAIRTQIYTILNNVSNIGKVYDYERYFTSEGDLALNIQSSITGIPQIRYWFVKRVGAPKTERYLIGKGAAESFKIQHNFQIEGYLGLEDSLSTEKTFNTLIEAICAVFRGNETLNNTCFYHEYIKVATISQKMLMKRLCHYTILDLMVHELST